MKQVRQLNPPAGYLYYRENVAFLPAINVSLPLLFYLEERWRVALECPRWRESQLCTKAFLTTLLTMQNRMNDSIASWTSKEMYEGLLKSSSKVSSHLPVDSPFVKPTWITQCPLFLLYTRMPYGSLSAGCQEHMDPAGTGSFYNDGEADIVLQHVITLILSVQSPYVAQVQLLRDRLDEVPGATGVEVATIDSFQGREADTAIISMVRSNNLGQRMNVAITRARKHVALVCDSPTICHNPFLPQLWRHIRYFGRVKHAEPDSFGGSGLGMDPMLPILVFVGREGVLPLIAWMCPILEFLVYMK